MNENIKSNIVNQFKTTELGFLRINKNLNIVDFSDKETEEYLRKILLSTPLENIETRGKNHYFECFEYNAILTVNIYSLTVITAKLINNWR
ncbi:DUF3781 domain-containing protein [Celerinatantimonas yamalensis]|uniref:DUF3781 domain-containing protein n=1 Tax=Celerinatantimonas yamalensis TaxID=559956 RepID=A0ABW9G732_9GAMM